jgi:hypothetical protein
MAHGRTHDQIFLPQIWDSPNLEGQAPVFICSRNRVTRLHTQALGSPFVPSYDSQGYDGGIRHWLHTGLIVASNCPAYNMLARSTEKTPFPNNSSIVIELCLPLRYIETVVLLLRACLAVNYFGFQALCQNSFHLPCFLIVNSETGAWGVRPWQETMWLLPCT